MRETASKLRQDNYELQIKLYLEKTKGVREFYKLLCDEIPKLEKQLFNMKWLKVQAEQKLDWKYQMNKEDNSHEEYSLYQFP